MSDRIWAPWRMQYIRSHAPSGGGCVLCDHASAALSRETGVLARRGGSFVVLNRYPYASAHLMVVPSVHVARPTDLDPSVHDELFRLVRDATACLEATTGAEGVNVGMNLGRAAGAGLADHLHVHVVPRWIGDQNFMPVIGDVRVMPEHLEATWDFLAPAFRAMDDGSP